ncbi:hypothetical protein H310_05173 [Aphanomyces invadans]|uniref:Uncharacterized protein n=1 Tax=Aphanomyces invadans TaxID=157072 RepID=A0A024UDU8_9STRA|nr:hypothetical protein H310_05173 [Aphanomyces invadans]ETW03808.1 hypothetical protein H310_05173 [Aphanomyces invadans]|eukprot:XP_008868037.1 hypothetical protein H310_05173 [Aphanomyces invadans]
MLKKTTTAKLCWSEEPASIWDVAVCGTNCVWKVDASSRMSRAESNESVSNAWMSRPGEVADAFVSEQWGNPLMSFWTSPYASLHREFLRAFSSLATGGISVSLAKFTPVDGRHMRTLNLLTRVSADFWIAAKSHVLGTVGYTATLTADTTMLHVTLCTTLSSKHPCCADKVWTSLKRDWQLVDAMNLSPCSADGITLAASWSGVMLASLAQVAKNGLACVKLATPK